MLDKSMPKYNIIMKMDWDLVQQVQPSKLPEGYTIRPFQTGDEVHWAKIEVSVLEFATEAIAVNYFKEVFLSHKEELEKRCLFLCNPEGIPVATANAWRVEGELGHQAALQWVALMPEYQGLGLGRAIVSAAMSLYPTYEVGLPVYLHTQTWSHVAVGLYDSLGFVVLKEERVGRLNPSVTGDLVYSNEYEIAMTTLDGIMDKIAYESVKKRAR
ncbi:GNAT family N-acetyltransferase [Chakrabartyella piscis]|uniref:GNAT family N-acetyltransferase n=1 Tax=Chakrabartyella piscis TaxID=2918914 RepID=UPI0029584F31|nr:GNAT family N-acetyltransferase [Chakrabartyella piscis]